MTGSAALPAGDVLRMRAAFPQPVSRRHSKLRSEESGFVPQKSDCQALSEKRGCLPSPEALSTGGEGCGREKSRTLPDKSAPCLLPSTLSPSRTVNSCFSCENTLILPRITAQFVNYLAKSLYNSMTYCHLSFVFIYIAGSTFIFNISKGQRPLSNLEKHS
jgi:hypothetical protein